MLVHWWLLVQYPNSWIEPIQTKGVIYVVLNIQGMGAALFLNAPAIDFKKHLGMDSFGKQTTRNRHIFFHLSSAKINPVPSLLQREGHKVNVRFRKKQIGYRELLHFLRGKNSVTGML